jgi:glucose/arabinose dehydrogenase
VPFNGPDEDFKLPVFRWLPSIGASGLDVAKGAAFPGWRGDLLAGGLAGQNVDRIRIEDGVMTEREELIHGLGRIRDIRVHADGTVYVILNRPDKIIRLVPAN